MLRKSLLTWIPIASAVVALTGIGYVTAQQLLRMGANDPQVQLARDVASSMAQGKNPLALFPPGQVDLTSSLAPFVLVYDEAGGVVATTAVLHGQVPELPAGVREFASDHGENRVTWQPEPGVRVAAVVAAYEGGTVLVGRSLREVEERIETLGRLTLAGLAGALLLTLLAALASEMILRRPAGQAQVPGG